MIKVQTFVSTMACTDYTFALCVPSQKTEDFLHALGKALEFYGVVPRIVVPDNLKAAVIKADKYEPVLNKAMDDMGNHYGFVTETPPERLTSKEIEAIKYAPFKDEEVKKAVRFDIACGLRRADLLADGRIWKKRSDAIICELPSRKQGITSAYHFPRRQFPF